MNTIFRLILIHFFLVFFLFENKNVYSQNGINCKKSYEVNQYLNFPLNKRIFEELNFTSSDFWDQDTFPSIDIDKEDSLFIVNISSYQVKNRNLIAIDTVSRSVLVNSNYFSSLKRVNVLGLDLSQKVGLIKNTNLLEQDDLTKVIEILMHITIINTFNHLRAEICLKKIVTGNEELIYEYQTKHYWCTNDCFDETIDFKVTVNLRSGELVVSPGD